MKIGKITLDCALALEPDAATIECMARLQIAALERGGDLSIENASPALRGLIAASTREPLQPMPGPNHQVMMSSRPLSHMSYGGIDWVASSRMRAVSADRS